MFGGIIVRKQQAAKTVLSYLLWAISTVIMIYGVFLVREFYVILLQLTNISHWVIGAIDKFTLIIVGVVIMGLIIFIQNYYERTQLVGFLLVTAIQVMLVAFFHVGRVFLINLAAPGVLQTADIVIFLVAIVIGALLIYLRRHVPYSLANTDAK